MKLIIALGNPGKKYHETRHNAGFLMIDYLQEKLNALTATTQPKWGKMTAQHLVEHMEFFTQMALGNVETEITTPEKYMEKTQDSLWDYRSMPKEFDHPILKKGEVEDLRFAKQYHTERYQKHFLYRHCPQ